jgi:glycosyltransferase involved in cell wall biosynthesis
MSNALVSVIIPTYNRAHLVGRAIDSALAQTHTNVELIVVDDGSIDGTYDSLKRQYATEPRVVCVRQENKGVAGARNAGIRVARGRYVAFLDSDDTWKPWKLELQLSCLDCFPEAGMIWTDMEGIDPDGRLVSSRFLRTMYRASYRWFPTSESLFLRSELLAALIPSIPGLASGARVYVGDIASQMLVGNLVHTSTVLLRRERLECVGEFDESLKPIGEDFDFHLRTCQAGPVAFADVSSIQYRVGAADQLTSEHQVPLAKNFLKILEPALKQPQRGNALPASMVASVQAEAHAWLGRELLARGDRVGARKHLAQSLRYRTFAPPALLLFILSCCPSFTYALAKNVVHVAKRAFHRTKQPQ